MPSMLFLFVLFSTNLITFSFVLHQNENLQRADSSGRLGMYNLASSPRLTRFFLRAAANEKGGGEDIFEYFDPLLSPHAYPNGIGPKSPVVKDAEVQNQNKNDDDSYDPLSIFRTSQSGGEAPKLAQSTQQSAGASTVDTDHVFDPRISPHEYSSGEVPSTVFGFGDEGSEKEFSSSERLKTVGILLMDHGSRSAASNQRLHDLARLYQEMLLLTASSEQEQSTLSRVVVRAAHMEIASPSIEYGLQTLLQEGVDEIICHPYFLSPGRHVNEDIPRIVEDAIQSLRIHIPVVTTSPVGSNTDVMIRAIHSLVTKSSSILK